MGGSWVGGSEVGGSGVGGSGVGGSGVGWEMGGLEWGGRVLGSHAPLSTYATRVGTSMYRRFVYRKWRGKTLKEKYSFRNLYSEIISFIHQLPATIHNFIYY